ncbi:MAG: hypothetical protein ABIR78_05050, partial [Ferruginibacter sp.]
KGLKLLNKGTKLSVTFKDPLPINYEDSTEQILEQIMDAIEQSKKFKPAPSISTEGEGKREELSED